MSFIFCSQFLPSYYFGEEQVEREEASELYICMSPLLISFFGGVESRQEKKNHHDLIANPHIFSIIQLKRKDKTYLLTTYFVQRTLVILVDPKWLRHTSLKSMLFSGYLIFFFEYMHYLLCLFLCKIGTIRSNPQLIWVPVNKWYLVSTGLCGITFCPCGLFVCPSPFTGCIVDNFAKGIMDSSVSQTSSLRFNCTRSTYSFLNKATTHCSECCLFYFWLDLD